MTCPCRQMTVAETGVNRRDYDRSGSTDPSTRGRDTDGDGVTDTATIGRTTYRLDRGPSPWPARVLLGALVAMSLARIYRRRRAA